MFLVNLTNLQKEGVSGHQLQKHTVQSSNDAPITLAKSGKMTWESLQLLMSKNAQNVPFRENCLWKLKLRSVSGLL